MSVQNLRNKFSQNNGTVPYNPPGLSYGEKPAAAVQRPMHNNNGKLHNGFGGQPGGGGGGGIGRFKTIREEPDGVVQQQEQQRGSDVKSPTKNNSFLLSYQRQAANAKTAGTAVAPPQAEDSANGTAPATQQSFCKFTPSKFVPSRPSATPFSCKSPPPAVPSSAQSSKFAVKSPPAAESPSPASFAAKLSSPVLNGSPATGEGKSGGGGNGPVGDKWRAKYDETESKRKSLLTQSQKREV